MKKSYEQWLADLDEVCWELYGVGFDDLPDVLSCWDEWEAGVSPKAAARKIAHPSALL
jgi:hypothetical protein